MMMLRSIGVNDDHEGVGTAPGLGEVVLFVYRRRQFPTGISMNLRRAIAARNNKANDQVGNKRKGEDNQKPLRLSNEERQRHSVFVTLIEIAAR